MKLNQSERALKYMNISLSDFRDLDPLDRYYFHFLDPERYKLRKNERRYFEHLKIAFSELHDKFNDKDVIKRVCKIAGIKTSLAYRVVREAKMIFGKAYFHDKRFEQTRLLSLCSELYEKAKSENDFEIMIKALKLYSQISDVMTIENELKPEDLKLPTFVITSNPSAIKKENNNKKYIQLKGDLAAYRD